MALPSLGFPQDLQFVFFTSLLLSSISVLVLLITTFVRSKTKKPNLPPGPWKLPIIGNLHQLGAHPHISLHRLAQKLGPILYLKLGQIPTVVVSSPRLAKEVLKTHDLVLATRPDLYAAKHLFYNCSDIAFSPYGPYWRHVRKISTLEVLSAKQVHQYAFIRDEEVARLVARIRDSSSSGPFNLSHLLGLYSNDVVCRATLGRDFSSGGEYDRHGFQRMLEEYQELLGGLSVGDFFPSAVEFVSSLTGMKSRLAHTSRQFDQLFEEVIQEHRDSKQNMNKQDIVNVLLRINADESRDIPLTMDNVKAIMLDMFAAGTDTSFITLDWAMTELITNPRVLRKAQAEVRTVVGDRISAVSETDLQNLQYMKAIIKETFRLHPAAPVLLPRESIQDVVIDGYEIPAKTRIFVNAWAIGRDPEVWESPDEFKPERFMGMNSSSNIDYKGQDFELIPFGGGRRICPGISFAIATIEIALAHLLLSFDWELPPGILPKHLDMTEVFGITMHRKDKLVAVAKPYFN